MIAHIFGVPIEEMAMPWIAGGAAGAALLVLSASTLRLFDVFKRVLGDRRR